MTGPGGRDESLTHLEADGDGAAPPASVTAAAVGANLAALRRRIAGAGADPDAVTVVAVTKGFPAAAVEAAREVGLGDVGENYAQELLAKQRAAGSGIRWHFLGPVQRNKVAALAAHVSCWHTIDRVSVGQALAVRRPGARVFVQVNSTGEATKHGCRPEEAGGVVDELRRLGLDVAGLMTIGPAGEPEAARPAFRLVADLGRRMGLHELSMGMTGDVEVAVQEGATVVRIGRGLFGPRDQKAPLAAIGSLNGGN